MPLFTVIRKVLWLSQRAEQAIQSHKLQPLQFHKIQSAVLLTISSQVSIESVTGVAESLEAIAALVSGAKGRLEKRSRLPRQGASGEHDRLVGIFQEIEGRVEYYQEALGALRGKVEYSCE